MKVGFEKTYHELESTHWWFKSRRSYIKDLLKHYSRESKILDIGCSSGILLSELSAQGFDINNLYGVDISQQAIKKCKEHGLVQAFVMDAQDIQLNEKFDVIIASDCLEHLEDDAKAIESWTRHLKEGGELFVFVPAFRFLWSSHDVANMHFRRYTKSALRNKLLKAENLQIVKSSYWNFFLFIPVSLFRLINNGFSGKDTKPKGDLSEMPALLNAGLSRLIALENRMLAYLNFPFGVSTYCIARKTTALSTYTTTKKG